MLTELMKLKTVTDINVSIWHLRDQDGREIDFILEGPGGAVIGIEVKASASPGADAARHLRWLKGQLGEKFTAGIILHLGTRSTSFGDGIYALPLSALWGHATM